ncbi:MAG: HIT family protein [Haloarculaceae archaeon]
MSDSCPFCRIVAGERDAFRVYEDDDTLGFLDHAPAVEGHALVVPKRHVAGLADMDEATTAATFTAARRVALALEAALDADGSSLFYSSGAAAGQDVFHAHVHVFPRHEDDPVSFVPSRDSLDAAEGGDLAARVRDEL